MTEGDPVFILGFPMGLVGEARNHPIVRYGIIARIQDWLGGESDSFLIDSPTFPGNSGGPVLLQPQVVAVSPMQRIDRQVLLGVVRSYIPYQDVAVSRQTGRPRVTFEENSGLAEVVPIDTVLECCDAAMSRLLGPSTVSND